MARLVLVFGCLIPAFAQSPFQNPAEFTRVLREVLAAVSPLNGQVADPKGGARNVLFDAGSHVADLPALPAAAFCQKTPILYRCYWEAKPNKYSVAVLADDISVHVAAAVPSTWQRTKGESMGIRYAEFTDPAGEVVITVSSQIALGDRLPTSYAASLLIHRAQLQMR